MSSRHRLKPVAPLKSALPDVFLRKNKFEERILENKRKFLENAEKKVIDRLAREQEEFAILNCMCIGSGTDSVASTSETFGSRSDNFESRSKGIESNSDNFTLPFESTEKSSARGKLVNESVFPNRLKNQPNSENSCAVNKITQQNSKRNHFRRSKSDTTLTYMRTMAKTEWKKSLEVHKTEGLEKGNHNERQTDEKRVHRKPPLRPTLSLPEQNGLKKIEKTSAGIKMRAKSAPAQHTRVAFSGRDGRPMSLTPVIRQLGHVSINDQGPCSRPSTAVKSLRDLPRMAQVQLKNNVYFLSQHKIQQQNEMAKIRTRRAMSAKTPKYYN